MKTLKFKLYSHKRNKYLKRTINAAFRKAGGAKIGDRSPSFLIWTPIAVALKKVGISGASKF
jgi:hypothetical protein